MFEQIILSIAGATISLLIIIIGWFCKDKFKMLQDDIKNIRDDIKGLFKKITAYGEDIAVLKKILYGHGHSPLRLKDEYKKILMESNLDEQIINKKQEFICLIQSKKLSTKLDAQRIIDESIDEIIPLLDLENFKNKAYEAGLPVEAIKVIISLYLYEIIIPELKFN